MFEKAMINSLAAWSLFKKQKHIFNKHLGNIATVLLDSVRLSLFCFVMSFQTKLTGLLK